MLPPGIPPARAQCRQVASTSRRGGIPVPGARLGLRGRRMAPNGVTRDPRLVPSSSLGCSRLNITGFAVSPSFEVRADYSAHFCVALPVMIRGWGAAGGGHQRMDCGHPLNLFLPVWRD